MKMKERLEQWKEVGVDQPALVKKILSDYSGPFDVFRELIQNADDANAENIEIHFRSEKSEEHLDDSLEVNVHKWIIRDDGDGLVDDNQWERLCMIAKGNEDPEKVGTFGVGFYTVLGVCDVPLLKSKGKYLEICLGDELRVKRGQCETDEWTSVELVLKNGLKERLPKLPDLARFLISSITFLERVNTIAVLLAGRKALFIRKNIGPSSPVEIPVIISSPGIMAIKSINLATQLVSVHAIGGAFLAEPKTCPNEKTPLVKSFSLSPQAPNQTTTSRPSEAKMERKFEAAYCLYTAQIEAHPSEEMVEGVKSVMKGLPRDFLCKAVYFRAEQQKVMEESSMGHLFDGLDGILPHNNSGRIFVGQSTKEPTGIGLHVASKRMVPDVVRGSVRLGNGQVDKWNESLLNIAGYLARVIYEQEMETARKLGPDKLKELGLYTMQKFAFDRNPAIRTSLHLKSGFFLAPKQSVLSSSGVSDVSLMRRHDEDLHSVFRNIPYLHMELSPEQRKLLEKQWKIPYIGYDDMVAEFVSRRLSEAGMERFFSWWEDATQKGTLLADEQAKKDFFEDLRHNGQLYCEECGVIELKGIKRYTQLTHHKDLLPPATIYIPQAQTVTNYLHLLGWEPLDPISWLRFVCKLDHMDPNKPFDSRVLTALAGPHGIPATSSQSWDEAANRLAPFQCMSTNHGFKRPCDSYFRIAGIWSDIPVVNDRNLSDHVYERLGVRSRLQWGGLLDRLETSTAYTNDRFLPYLADIMAKEGLSDQQIGDLKRRNVFDSETHGKFAMTVLHQLDKLGDRLRELRLPILALHGTDGRVPTDLPSKLGVRVYPPLEVIDKWLATSDDIKVKLAIQCLMENGGEYREEAKKPGVALIPTKGGILAHPNEVFSGSSWEELGFPIISGSLADHAATLGVQKNPPADILINRLENETMSMEMARRWFKQLSRCNEISLQKSKELGQVPFIPFAEPHLLAATSQCLKDCYVMSALPEDKPHLKDILPFVEFGDDENLLATNTAKTESPKASDIAWAMVARPQSFLELAGVHRYENDLREIAKEYDSFCEELQEAMRTSSILLGQRKQDGSYELKQGCEILIGGDRENISDFCRSVFIAPDGLKTLYEKLGSKPLDSCVVYHVYPTDTERTPSLPLSPEDVLQCVNIFKEEEPEQEWQFNISSCRLLACRKLELVKRLDYSPGVVSENIPTAVPSREVAAGLGEDSHDSITLWIVRDHKNLYTDIATALCRKLKTYSRRDVLAMKLLLIHKESRTVQSVPGSGDMRTIAPTTINNAPCGLLEGQRDTYSNNFASAPHPTSVTPRIQRRVLKWLPKLRKESPVVVSKLDPVKLAKEAIDATRCKANPSEESQRLFKELLTGFKKKDIHCRQVDTYPYLEADEHFKKHDIMFFKEKKSRYPGALEDVVETFAKRVIDLASVFEVVPHSTFCMFWKDTDPNLMAFNRKGGYIYLNLAYYYRHHYKRVHEKRIIMDWYLIFAHEIAHNVSFHHDMGHETAFAGLCVSRLDALRKRFPYDPPLGLMSRD